MEQIKLEYQNCLDSLAWMSHPYRSSVEHLEDHKRSEEFDEVSFSSRDKHKLNIHLAGCYSSSYIRRCCGDVCELHTHSWLCGGRRNVFSDRLK